MRYKNTDAVAIKEERDLVKVAHGNWIETKRDWDFDPFYYTDYQCSACGMREQNKSPFCRWCGAKMVAEKALAEREGKG